MSDVLFDRKVALRFGVPGEAESGLAYTDLRIKFTIEKTSEPAPNKSKIQVYNLTRVSRGLAERKGIVLILSAGYGNKLEDIFSGNIARVVTSLEGSDYVTEFEAGDGEKAFQEARLDMSFAAGTNLKDIVGKAVDTLGLALGDVTGIASKTILNGLSLSGLTRKHLDELVGQAGAEWSIQDGAVQIIEKDGATKGDSVYLSKDTGLVGIPKKKDKGIECVSLLQPRLKPGAKFELQSQFISGKYRVMRVSHVGDTHGPEWYSNVEAIEL